MIKRIAMWLKWHRRAGLLLAPVIVMLALTGVMINHSQSWGWYEKPVYSSLLRVLYGIPPLTVSRGFAVPERGWVTQSGDDVRLEQTTLLHCPLPLAGALGWSQGMVLLCDGQLHLYTRDGELIETMSDLPASQEVGLSADGALLLAGRGTVWLLDDSRWEWQSLSVDNAVGAQWAMWQSLPAADSQRLSQSIPLPGISRERVLLDLHSGRLFGDWGVWLVDLSAILMVFLALSGSLTWALRRWRKRSRTS
ncbi:PepSY domain-containing protein [Thalassolituus marinus]|uniref:PepSY domain-containing protein n=1 Tax=Thalassolituus marinus TaxID=671053 RepID=A0ABS7ZLU4_9GAMM|nr:PepSY domain-containing protein [Thalassolituus marinus]MCA6062665.1 PepSY domain-containing protein [Thalassolituus marinus]